MRLRRDTAQHHARLEAALPLLDPALPRERYRALLERFWGYHAALEARLHAGPHWGTITAAGIEPAKTPHLERDLRALGGTAAGLPQCRRLPALSTLPRVLGCLYVIEGATLGGQVVARHLLSSCGLTADSGAAFFSGYGVDNGRRWLAFRDFLTLAAAPLEQDDLIVASANATFETLGAWVAEA